MTDDLLLPGVDLPTLGRIATAVSEPLRPGDVLALTGPLASGKTQFVQMLCEALKIEGPVTSPTFTLAHFYDGPGLGILHVDAYRIESEAEFADLTLDDFLDRYALAVEWGDKFRAVLPPALEIEFTPATATTRTVRVGLSAPAWHDRADQIRNSLSSVTECR